MKNQNLQTSRLEFVNFVKEKFDDVNSEIALISGSINSQLNIFSLINEINNLLKSQLSDNDLLSKAFSIFNNVITLEKYYLIILDKELILYEKNCGLDLKYRDYLIDNGVIKLILEEKRSLILSKPDDNDIHNNLLIVPVINDTKLNLIFVFEIKAKREEILNELFPLFEMSFNLVGSNLLNRFIENDRSKMSDFLQKIDDFLREELNYSTAGKLCLKSFHYLKNRTQVILSAFNILLKSYAKSENDQLSKIFDILNGELPKFSKAIRLVSETSKKMIDYSKPTYFEIEKILSEMLEISEISGINNNLNINMKSKNIQSKIYSNYEKLLQALLLLLIEIQSRGADCIDIEIEENTLRLNLIFKLKNQLTNKTLKSLLEEKVNTKFERIKELLTLNSCAIITKSSQLDFEILISIPKRSSQYKAKVSYYDKSFSS